MLRVARVATVMFDNLCVEDARRDARRLLALLGLLDDDDLSARHDGFHGSADGTLHEVR